MYSSIDYIDIDGDPIAEAGVLRIALCDKFQKEYTDLYTVCKSAGLYQSETESIRLWKYHHIGECSNEINRLLDYIQYYEPERFKKSLILYIKNNKK